MKNIYFGQFGKLLIILAVFANTHVVSAQSDTPHSDNYNTIELQVEQLPDLNTARTGHITMSLDGELAVFGGHTDSFVMTPTAEYFHDGTWHTVPLAYPHDHATAIALRSGKVLIAGGHKEDLGIGQLFAAELYDPETHTSRGFGCMDMARAFAGAIEMADGQVVISGNWYADDGVEMFDNVYDHTSTNANNIKEVSFPRAHPYILRVSDDEAIIFGALDNENNLADYAMIDCLKGSSYREPFLITWNPLHSVLWQNPKNLFIGNEAKGIYRWLIPVEDESGQVAIARVSGPKDDSGRATFELLSTMRPVPTDIRGKHILYSSLICDAAHGMAYLIGEDDEARIYVVAVEYNADGPAPMTVYVTDPQPIFVQTSTPALTPEGDIVFAGGHRTNNFSPSDAAILLPVGQFTVLNDTVASADSKGVTLSKKLLWLIIPGVLIIAAAILLIVFLTRRKSGTAQNMPLYVTDEAQDVQELAIEKNMPKDDVLADLFRHIDHLMQTEQLYLNPNLKTSDIAARIGSNVAYVSAAINTHRGCSFSQFLISYRIAYAQELLRQNPDAKISTISAMSGFSTDSTFFRAFKSITGMSPKEWLARIKSQR